AFGPLLHLIEQSSRVSDTVIIPVSSFGFGNAILRAEGGEREGAHPEPEDDPFASEPIWLLREGVSAQPFNLDTLLTWTLLFGLLNQTGPGILEADTDLGQICRTLAEDLDAINPWFLRLKGGLAWETTSTAGVHRA